MAQKPFNLKREIERLDSQQMGLAISLLKEQILQVDGEFSRFSSLKKKKWSSVVICAMGGSGLGADILRNLYRNQLAVPLEIIHEYTLPHYVDSSTLVITITYSGGTEEIISCYKEARKRKAGLFAIASGGQLAKLAKLHTTPAYIFDDTKNNPSGQPRMGNGFTMTAVYKVLQQAGVLKRGHEDLIAATKSMHIDASTAFTMARKTSGKVCVLIGAEHLFGNAHVISNQINENAKILAPYYAIPEINHHLMEGLEELKGDTAKWRIIFLESDKYDSKIQRRFRATKNVVDTQGLSHMTIRFPGSKAAQSMKLFQFGSWWGYYSAILSGRDPAPIPWVDHFKEVMKR